MLYSITDAPAHRAAMQLRQRPLGPCGHAAENDLDIDDYNYRLSEEDTLMTA